MKNLKAKACARVSTLGIETLRAVTPYSAEDGLVHPLREDLDRTAKEFAGAFGAAGWGCPAGLWHDLEKTHPLLKNLRCVRRS